MNASISSRLSHENVDRVGVAASVLCAIHCAITPLLLLFLPTFGSIWAHPLSHILVAVFVIPLAIFSIYKGYNKHRKLWIISSALLGILLVIAGAIVPAFEPKISTAEETSSSSTLINGTPTAVEAPAESSDTDTSSCSSCASCDTSADTEAEAVTQHQPTEPMTSTTTSCVDQCCPSLITTPTGETQLHIPLAAIITTLGGAFLIAAHIGNLCFTRKSCQTSCCNHCTT